MKRRLPAFHRVFLGLFCAPLLWCGSAQAGLLRYDIVFDGENLGHLVFEAQLGSESQNLWDSLVHWALGVDGVSLDSSNSVAGVDRRFIVDAVGSVIDDSKEVFSCAPYPFICIPNVEVTENPFFLGQDGSSIQFFHSDYVGGTLGIDTGGGVEYFFGSLAYAGPVAVPLPATGWLLLSAWLGLAFARRPRHPSVLPWPGRQQ